MASTGILAINMLYRLGVTAMATYKKLVTVWEKTSFEAIPASVLEEIEAKQVEMKNAGTMDEQVGQLIDETKVTMLYRFQTQEAVNEWISFIDAIATANNVTKISSRIVDVQHAD